MLWMYTNSIDVIIRHGNCTPIGVYTRQLSSQHSPRYIQYAPRLWVKKPKKVWNCSSASFRFGIGKLAIVVSVNPLASESTLFLGMRNAVLYRPFWFLDTVLVRCHVHEQINTAYQTDIVQRDGSFCDENCRLWMKIEWNQLEIREFSSDSAKASGCRYTGSVDPCAHFGWWFQKLLERGKAYCIVCRSELCYADRRAVFFFTTHASSEGHQQKLWAESSDSTLPWVEWCLPIRVIICWTDLLHLRLFTGQLMAVLNSATCWPTTAHMSVLRQSSLVLKLYCCRICKHSTFKRRFHHW